MPTNPLKRMTVVAFSGLALLAPAFGQSDVATFRVDSRSTFVWGEDMPSGAKSWSVRDPLTGTETLKMSHEGVEVSSRMGFEKLHPEESGELIAFTTTIANNTSMKVSVETGEIAVDGRIAPPLSIDASRKARGESNSRTNVVRSGKLYCFTSGFLSSENLVGADSPSAFVVGPRSSLSISSVFQDPRHYSILCSLDGCFPKGSIRHAIRVGGHEYIFVWPGRSVVNCGR